MAQVNMSIPETALADPFEYFLKREASVGVRRYRELNVVKPLRKDVSSIDYVPSAVSAREVGDMRVIRAPESAIKKTSVWSEINQTWEGRVIENSPGSREFVAIISDRTCKSNPDEEVVIGYESVIESDLDLISEGAVFFWNIGKYRKYSEKSGKVGPAVNKYELRFRRLPPVSAETIEHIKTLSKGLSKIIHGH
ncbi:hypothetical protein HX786_11875 [Pseudomonas sp. 21615526]|uniref:hypothetical protein n=1 Tax=Pseudomonas sp. 21615526 TaxID=2738811 RepID=UPI0015B92743|nr:hypothetical protein [Pseudomonas sp. 21615526]NVZ38777.1 hypothetical protein [Pseudomonas sp. 21615526]